MTETVREIKEFEATLYAVGTSSGIVIPAYIVKYVGLKKGQKLKVKLEVVDDGRAGIRTCVLTITGATKAKAVS